MRIVWYFDAATQTRAFTVSYTLRGVAIAYDDVVDVNLRSGATSGTSASRGCRIETRPEDPARLGQARVGAR